MAILELNWWCLETALPGGLLRLDALGFPELGAIGSTRKSALVQLERRLQALAEAEPSLPWHRRIAPAAVRLDALVLPLPAPPQLPDWQSPVALNVHYACWSECADRHLAWAPAAAVGVMAEHPDQVAELLRAELRLLLAQRRLRPGLAELAARHGNGGTPELSGVRTTLKLASPRDRLRATDAQTTASAAPTLAAVASALEPKAIARTEVNDAVLGHLAEALAGSGSHSVLLLGPEGCGKTTLWRQLVARQPALGLKDWRCWQTSGARLIAGQSGYGMWQQRLRELCRELAQGQHLLHLGPLRELLEVGRCRAGEQSIGEYLRGEIARGGIRVLVEATPEELAAIERDHPGMGAVFTQVLVEPPSAVQQRRLLEAAFAEAAGDPVQTPAAARPALDLLHALHLRYAGHSARPARALRFLRERLAQHFPQRRIAAADVFAAFSAQTGLPAVLLDPAQALDPEAVSAWFDSRVIGQAQATAIVIERLLAIRTGLTRAGRPLASLLLVGPTGTGKTELARTLATWLFGAPDRLTRFDLGELTDAGAVARLIGGPAAGSSEGLLTGRVRQQPFCVLLFDEFEKADAGFFDLLLQILGDARLTDGAGRVADFSNTVILLTSNLGAAGFQRGRSGFVQQTPDVVAHFEAAVQSFVRPELYNRFDAIVPFLPLAQPQIERIASGALDALRDRPGLAYGDRAVEFDPALAPWLATRGTDLKLGARPLQRVLERTLVTPLATALNQPHSGTVSDLTVRPEADQVIIERSSARQRTQAPALDPWRRAADAAVSTRRQLDALDQSSCVQKLRDESALIKQRLVRLRQQHLRKHADRDAAAKAPPDDALLPPQEAQRLRLLGQVLSELRTAVDAAVQAEDVALLSLWDPEQRTERGASAVAADGRVLPLRRALYRASLAEPDQLHLAVYSEHAGWLRALLAAYLSLTAAPPRRIQVLPRPPALPATWQEVPHLKALAQWPDGRLLGVQVALEGELIAGLLSREAGLHSWRVGNETGAKAKVQERVALVQVGTNQLPPSVLAGRSLGIARSGLPLRRQLNESKAEIHDPLLDPERQPWTLEKLETLVPRLVRAALDRVLERLHLD